MSRLSSRWGRSYRRRILASDEALISELESGLRPSKGLSLSEKHRGWAIDVVHTAEIEDQT